MSTFFAKGFSPKFPYLTLSHPKVQFKACLNEGAWHIEAFYKNVKIDKINLDEADEKFLNRVLENVEQKRLSVEVTENNGVCYKCLLHSYLKQSVHVISFMNRIFKEKQVSAL